MSRATRIPVALAALVAIVCPACGQSIDTSVPQTGADVRRVDVDAPQGVCRGGTQRVAHIGCVDDEVSFSPDAVEACRSSGEAECRARCDKGDSGACTALAVVHQFALETTPNTTYAARLLGASCAAGDGGACNDLGVMYAKGLGFPIDVEHAEGLYSVACAHGDVVGCVNLARSRVWAESPPPHVADAVKTVQAACVGSGNARACAAVGWMRARGSVLARDEHLATTFFDKACAAGDVGACEHLGRAYLSGDGVAPDDVTALRLFRRGCDVSRADACTDLASMYCGGRGVPVDRVRSAALLRQACEAGYDPACHAGACGGNG